MPTPVLPSATPTQVKRPWRTTARTAFQTALAVIPILGLVVPEVVRIILEESGAAMPDHLRVVLLAAAAVVVALASIVARVMAIPQVEAFLTRHGFVRPLAANPAPQGQRRLDYHLED